ncbi:MAG: glutamate--cysteine ligase [Thioalkalivibrionaceae bacterium]
MTALTRVHRNADGELLPFQGTIGLEKESLRVTPEGRLAQTPHPRALGSTLTHPAITTDYSEALIELITPPFADARETLGYLEDLHAFVYAHINNERLWATSMPCVVNDDARIPVAQYGPSHRGRMKTIYRVGLGHRYGRKMQVIAGVHFNYAPPASLFEALARLDGHSRVERAWRDERWMGLIRNLLRFGWIVPYLFGASPAVCNSFVEGHGATLEPFDAVTSHLPYATSLRMGDIGYTNRIEADTGIKACYDDLTRYTASLRCAIETPSPRWHAIGLRDEHGEWRQLNDHILQIENEYYASVRPKQPLRGLERPVDALDARGIAYVELRSLDVNAQHPLGIDETTLRFIETLAFGCLLWDSPPLGSAGMREVDRNLLRVAHEGRRPDLALERDGTEVPLRQWSRELLSALRPIACALDRGIPGDPYRRALAEQWGKVEDPQLTPSARMLEDMRARDESFFEHALRLSAQHSNAFRHHGPLPRAAELEHLAAASLAEQARLDATIAGRFEDFLAEYFAGRLGANDSSSH